MHEGITVKRIITFGTFDVFHIGHLNILSRARRLGDELVVGVSSDSLSLKKKNRNPIYSQEERLSIVSSLRFVDEVFLEESLELKEEYIRKFNASVLVMGDDWKGHFDHLNTSASVVYLERTPTISTTAIIETIREG